jgi:hypothetical protein
MTCYLTPGESVSTNTHELSLMGDYALAMIAGIWLADGLLLLVAPRFIITHLRRTLTESPTILRWEWLAVLGGGIVLVAGQTLLYQPLWMIMAGAMIAKGLFLSMGPSQWRTRILDWCLSREDVDYRFWGLSLCALATLLFRALGWINGS